MTLANRLANRIDLQHMVPSDVIASTGYALANTGASYLVYQPGTAAFTVALPAAYFDYQWIDPATGATSDTVTVNTPGGATLFSPPVGYPSGALLSITASP